MFNISLIDKVKLKMSGDEDDDDDFMSDDILKQCEAAATKTAKSGGALPKLASQSTVRKISIQKRHESDIAKRKQESEKLNPQTQLQKGLTTALPSDNVGFKLLSKMGFKPGSGVGKSASGRAEPIPLEFRQGRSGLGLEEVKKKIESEREAARQKLIDRYRGVEVDREQIEKQFTEAQRQKKMEHQVRRDLTSSRKACFDLDSKIVRYFLFLLRALFKFLFSL